MSNSDGYILILGGEFALRERVLAGALRAGGGRPVFTLAKGRLGNTMKFFDGFIAADVADPAAVVDAARRFEREHGLRPAAAVPMNDFTVRSALALAKEFTLLGNPEATVDVCRDKFLMKQRLQAAGLPVPRFAAFDSLAQLRALAGDFGYPLVIKPRELAGSVGVIKVHDAGELDAAFARCQQDIRNLGGVWRTPEDVFQVEQYVPAQQEVSVEVFNHGDLHRALAVTDKHLGPEPYFVETGHSVPSVHGENRALIDIAERACAALDIRHGIAHFEARITPEGEVRIIEVGARTGGDAIMDLVERVYGINPYELHVGSYLGSTAVLPKTLLPRGLSAVAFLKAPVGRIARVHAAGALPESVVNLQISAKPLDASEPAVSWRAREGSVELFWKGRPPETKLHDHLDLAQQLSARLFEMQSA
ncbi:MAG: ATP-grasp domain-containing protein [Rubrivivax sp.]|nr:ATP-grasp domain-containing protein [Rubrivivax sp.]